MKWQLWTYTGFLLTSGGLYFDGTGPEWSMKICCYVNKLSYAKDSIWKFEKFLKIYKIDALAALQIRKVSPLKSFAMRVE